MGQVSHVEGPGPDRLSTELYMYGAVKWTVSGGHTATFSLLIRIRFLHSITEREYRDKNTSLTDIHMANTNNHSFTCRRKFWCNLVQHVNQISSNSVFRIQKQNFQHTSNIKHLEKTPLSHDRYRISGLDNLICLREIPRRHNIEGNC